MAEKQNGMLDDLQVHVIQGRKESDITYLWNGSGLYLVNERAKNSLESMLAESVEFIPVKNEKKLYLLNILCVADALDLNNIIATFNGGAITYIRKFSLIKEKIPKAPIFKVICEGSIYTGAAFVTDYDNLTERRAVKTDGTGLTDRYEYTPEGLLKSAYEGRRDITIRV